MVLKGGTRKDISLHKALKSNLDDKRVREEDIKG